MKNANTKKNENNNNKYVSNRIMSRIVNIITPLPIILFFIIIVGPLIWMVISSFKSSTEIFDNIWGLPSKWLISNYMDAWNTGISKYFINSVFVTIGTVLLTLLLCSLYAYSIVVYDFIGKKIFFILALCGLMFSPIVSMIPLYQEIQVLGLYNKRISLILVYTAYQMSMSFLLIYTFFKDIDKAYVDSAKIDGCNSFKILFKIFIPLSKPIFITSAVLTGFYAWNEFSFALIFIKDDFLKTIPIGLLAFQGEMHAEWGVLLAGLTISALPIIIFFLFVQKYFIAGISAGGVKG